MDTNVFTDKNKQPVTSDLKQVLGPVFEQWNELHAYVLAQYPSGKPEWYFPGVKYGWTFRIKDKRRAIIYLLPRQQHFLAAFNFGEKAVTAILKSKISEEIKTELMNARVYAEGRGIRIPVKDERILPDLHQLINIKLQY